MMGQHDFFPVLLTPDMVSRVHDSVLNPGEVQGLAGGKSLDGALARVETRVMYGEVDDAASLAAAYAMAVARGHCFNDGNKRTAYRVMSLVLWLNGAGRPGLGTVEETGDLIVETAKGALDEAGLTARLRSSDSGPEIPA